MSSDIIDYILAIFPIAVAHVFVPPLSIFEVVHDAPPEAIQAFLRSLYRLAPSFFFNKNFIYSCLLDANHNGEIHHTMLTHMFVHRNYEHLFGNLSWTLILGYPVFRRFGTLPMYLTYLAGGAFATLPLDKLYRQFDKSSSRQIGTKGVWSMLGDALKPAANYVKKVTESLGLSWKVLSCGSSGAVCTLLGCNCGYILHDLYWDLSKLMNGRGRKNDQVPLAMSVLFKFWQLYTMADFVQCELLGMQDVKAERSDWLRWLAPRDSINHEAHLQGFGFGVALTAISMLFQR